MDEELFYDRVRALLQDIRPTPGLPQAQPDTHLWVAGYMDSLALLEVIGLVEELVGHELQLSGDFLPTFFTMRAMFVNHVGHA